jgi:peroxiredoxin/YHS domain-containing protein
MPARRLTPAVLVLLALATPPMPMNPLLPASALAAEPEAQATRATKHWNLAADALAISGYDPVAYFPEAGGKPAKGKPEFALTHGSVRYHFASAANRDRFAANPARYEPAFGGWCAWAMREGDKVEIDPKSFVIEDDRLLLFYNGFLADTRAKWLAGNRADEARAADAQWSRLAAEAPRHTKPLAAASTTTPALADRLADIRAQSAAQMPQEVRDRLDQGVAALASTGILDRALKVGQPAPDFTLPDPEGGTHNLRAMLADGPVVVSFYRGSWCPYCTAQLDAYQAALPDMKAAGAQLVAISPELPARTRDLARKVKLGYPLLTDNRDAVAKTFGISYAQPEPSAPIYRPILERANGDPDAELPLAATYVIARDGTVAYAFTSADYRERADPAEVLAALKRLH